MVRISTIRRRPQRLAGESLAHARRSVRSGRKAAKSGWHGLADALGGMAGHTRSRLIEVQGEGRRRGKAAKDALAGRRPNRQRWVAGAAAVGVGVGAAATVLARKIGAALEQAHAQRAAAVVADELRRADTARSDGVERDAHGTGTNGPASTVVAARTPTVTNAAAPDVRKPTS